MHHIMMNFMNNYFNRSYSVINSADFLKIDSIPEFLQLSRMSTATYFNSTGNISDALPDTARFDYYFDGLKWINQGLLLEKQSTNLLTNSVNLNNFPLFNAVKGTSDTYSDIQGYTVTSNNSSQTSRFSQSLTNPGWQPFIAMSSIVKSGTSGSAMLISSGGPRTHYAFADLTAKTIVPKYTIDLTTFVQGEVKYLNNDRFYLNSVFDISTEGESTGGGGGVGAGSVTNGLTVTGYTCQLEQNKYSSSLIKTTSSAVTRAADILAIKVTKYTGSVLLKFKRQDSSNLETKWVDIRNTTNPNITDYIPVGCWLNSIKIYNRTLASWEKDYESLVQTLLVDSNFVQKPSLPNTLTLFRSSTATFYNRSGYMDMTGIDGARFDYGWVNSQWVNQGLLIEKQSTNLLNYSSNFQADKVGTNMTYSSGEATTGDNPTANSFMYQNPVFKASVPLYAYTLYSINENGSKPRYGISTTSTDLEGVVRLNNTSFAPVKEVDFNLFWKTTFIRSGVDGSLNTGLAKYVGNSPTKVKVVANQLEESSYNSSLIITNGSTVTRAADQLVLNLSNYTGSILLTYKRQDTDTIERKWVDLTSVTNAIISNYLDVGVWLRSIKVFNTILTSNQKNSITAIDKPVINKEFDFTSMSSLPTELSLSRASSATRFNNLGLLVDSGIDEARFNYVNENNVWKNQGLLLEKQSTNLQRYSSGDQFSNWTTNSSTNTTVSAASTSYAGISGARVSGTATGNTFTRAILPPKAVAVGDVITASFLCSLGTSGNIKCGFGVVGNEGIYYQNNQVSVVNGNNYNINSYDLKVENNNIVKAKFTMTITASHAGLPTFVGTNSNAGAVYNDVYAVQLETLPYSSSYIRTSSAQVTRLQDDLKLNVDSFTGTLQLIVKRQDNDVISSIWIDLNSATNPILTNNIPVGVHLLKLKMYEKLLTKDEKNFIEGAGNV